MIRRPILAALAVASLTVAGQAAAQPPDPVHKADALFNAGRSLLDAGEYAEACPKFAESNTLAPGLGVTLYLADCYERLGKTASALHWFRHAVELARAKNDKRGPVAAGRADALVARVPSLLVTLSPEAQAQHVAVTEDGAPLVPSAFGVATPVDPGDHVLDVKAEGKAPRHLVVHLQPVAQVHTETIGPLDNPAPAPVAPAVALAPAQPAGAADSSAAEPGRARGRGLLVAGITTGAVGVVGVGIGAAFGLMASSKLSDSNAGPCNASNHCTPAGLSLRSDAVHDGNTSTIAFAVGGAAVAAGVVMILVRPKSGTSSASLQLTPAVGRASAGASLGGAF